MWFVRFPLKARFTVISMVVVYLLETVFVLNGLRSLSGIQLGF
ncbi:MAG: hypothetical protein RIR28_903 [Pseudomonadota bacterium]